MVWMCSQTLCVRNLILQTTVLTGGTFKSWLVHEDYTSCNHKGITEMGHLSQEWVCYECDFGPLPRTQSFMDVCIHVRTLFLSFSSLLHAHIFLPFCFLPWDDTTRKTLPNVGLSNMDFPTARTIRKKFVLYKLSSLRYSNRTKWTKTDM